MESIQIPKAYSSNKRGRNQYQQDDAKGRNQAVVLNLRHADVYLLSANSALRYVVTTGIYLFEDNQLNVRL